MDELGVCEGVRMWMSKACVRGEDVDKLGVCEGSEGVDKVGVCEGSEGVDKVGV